MTTPDDRKFKPLDWTGLTPPAFPKGSVPSHVAVVMDGNGHRAGEAALLDVVAGAVQAGVQHLSVYAFSTENWKRSAAEVKFLMGFNREVLHRQRDQLHEWGVRVVWSGNRTRLWKSVISDLLAAEELTKHNTAEVAAGRLKPDRIREHHIAQHLYQPDLPDVDLFVRSSGEQRTSNFLLWESAYAEMVFLDTLWPDFTREDLWEAISRYVARDRRFGGAVDAPSSKLA
jgi:undecaprenyl diphosphate synthase